MNESRVALLDRLADKVISLQPDRPTLVAIDGRSAAGKTTFANGLAAAIEHKGRPMLRSSLDNFHPPGHKYRSAARRYTPTSYLAEGYDYATFRRFVLDPLLPGGDRRVRLAFWDSYHDAAVPEQPIDAPADAILVVDGIYLLSPDFRDIWDYAIWVEVDWPTMIARAAERDIAWVGSREVVIERYQSFWRPLHEQYEREMQPKQFADLIIHNEEPQAPFVISRENEAS